MLSCGDTFYTDNEMDDSEEPHLWIVISPPSEGEVVTVSVTTKRKRSETLVELSPGDHPYITRPSVIAFRYARIRSVDDIETAIGTGVAKKREPASPQLLKRVQDGLIDSDFTENGVRQFFKTVMNIK